MTPSASTAETIRRVGVVGPGLMGLGVAQAIAAAGFEAILCGRDVESARERLLGALKRQVARGRLRGAEESAILDRTSFATVTQAGLAACDLVIESVPEDRAIKTATLAAIARAAPDAIVATNTSGLSIARLGEALPHPSRFLGLHFFSPAERMPLVETVVGPKTSPAALTAALAFVRAIGKRPIVVRDGPGFFATGVFAAYLDEAVAMVAEGIAPDAIDEAATVDGRAMGPLAVLDETGVALNLAQARQARADGLAARYCRALAEPTLALLVDAGRSGRRAGGGFFDWGAGARTPWPGLAKAYPPAVGAPHREAIRLRLFAAEAREALRRLEEGIVASADDADAASILGLGYPNQTGGVLRAAEDFGLDALVGLCDRLAEAHGDRFAPSPWLRELAARGRGLQAFRDQRSRVLDATERKPCD
jgi:3-hydroxyacyl-CoA dehydrogenase/enoyl-CoA hydratase/3-hydroxybutyryl-CoA epimerase